MAAITSSAPAICGTFLGFTKLAASTRETPAAASMSQSLARTSGERIISSFCRPSRGPTSTNCTRIGSPPSDPSLVAPTLLLRYLREHGPARDEGALAVGQRSDPAGAGSYYGLLHLHGLEDEEQLPLLYLFALAHQHPHHRPRHRGRQAFSDRVRPTRAHPVHVGGRRSGEPVALVAEGDESAVAVEGEASHDGPSVHDGVQPPVLAGEHLDGGVTAVETDPKAANARTFDLELVLPLPRAVAQPYRPQVAPGAGRERLGRGAQRELTRRREKHRLA